MSLKARVRAGRLVVDEPTDLPGDESNGPVHATVTTYGGWPDPTKMNFEELAKKAHPQGDVNALMQQTESARSMVRTEIWQVLEQTDPPVAR